MASRPALLAAVAAARPLSETWAQAVRRLGAWRMSQAAPAAPAKKPGKPTGLSRGELFARMLKSHVFDNDRETWRQRWWQAPTADTFDEMKRTLEARKLTEKLAPVAA